MSFHKLFKPTVGTVRGPFGRETMAADVKVRDVLESRFAIYVLLLIKEKQGSKGCTKTDIIKAEEGFERTKFVRIKELEQVGLISFNTEKRQHNTVLIHLTERGQKIADLLDIALQQ